MALFPKLSKFLEKSRYKPVSHRVVYTAIDKAATLRVKPGSVVKALAIKGDRELFLAVLAANRDFNKTFFKKAINAWRKKQGLKAIKSVDFLKEAIMKKKFKEVKVGAMPPFGPLWNLTTVADKNLFKVKKLIVGSGKYDESLEMSSVELKKLLPEVVIAEISKAKK